MKKDFIKKTIPIASDIIIALVVALLFIKAPSDEDLKFNYLFIVSIGYICYALIHSVLFCVLIKDFFAVTSVKVIFISIVATIVFIPTPAFAITSFGTILCAISYFISKKQLLQKRLAISTAFKISIFILASAVLLRYSIDNPTLIHTIPISAISGFTYGTITYSHTKQVSVSCYGAFFIPSSSPVVTVIFSLLGALTQLHIKKQEKKPTSKTIKIKPKTILLLTDVFFSLIILCPLVVSILSNKDGDLIVFAAILSLGTVYSIYSAWFGVLCTMQKCKLLIFYFFRIALSSIIILCFAFLHPYNHIWATIVSSFVIIFVIISLSFIATVLSALLSSYLKNRNKKQLNEAQSENDG